MANERHIHKHAIWFEYKKGSDILQIILFLIFDIVSQRKNLVDMKFLVVFVALFAYTIAAPTFGGGGGDKKGPEIIVLQPVRF